MIVGMAAAYGSITRIMMKILARLLALTSTSSGKKRIFRAVLDWT